MRKIAATMRILAFLAISIAVAAVLFLYFSIEPVVAGLVGAVVFFAISYAMSTLRYAGQYEKFHAELIEYRKDTDQIIRQMSELRAENRELRQDISAILSGKYAGAPVVNKNEEPVEGKQIGQALAEKSLEIGSKVAQKAKALARFDINPSADETPDGQSQPVSQQNAEPSDVLEEKPASIVNAAIDRMDAVTDKIKSAVPSDLGTQASQSLSKIQERFIVDAAKQEVDIKDPVSRLIFQIQANELEIAMQPILEIPYRRLKFYDTCPRVPNVDGELVDLTRLVPNDGLMPFYAEVDAAVIPKVVAVGRRISQEMNRVKIFCPLSPAFLSNSDFSQEVLSMLEANKALNSEIVFKIQQREYERMAPVARGVWTQILELGFRFCIENPKHFRFDAIALQESGIDFVKVSSSKILDLVEAKAGQQQFVKLQADISASNIQLIADKIEEEQTVLELLDLDIAFAQGGFLAEPRLVKSDVAATGQIKKRVLS